MLKWPTSIRFKLTLWTIGVVFLILFLFCMATLWLSYSGIKKEFDNYLTQEFAYIERHLEAPDSGAPYIRKSHSSPTSQQLLQNNPRWVEVWDLSGNRLLTLGPLQEFSLGSAPHVKAFSNERYLQESRIEEGPVIRVMEGTVQVKGKELFVRVGLDSSRIMDQTLQIIWIFLGLLPLALILSAFGGYFLMKRALTPVELIVHKAESISTDNLAERIPILNQNDELGRLTMVLNRLLDRIEKSFLQLKRFTSDASHELRTPLTALRSMGEVALQAPQSAEYYRAVIASGLEEVDWLNRLVSTLLQLSRADAGTLSLELQDLDLKKLAQESVELLLPLSEDKKQELSIQYEGEVKTKGDPVVLRQIFINLIDNAIKHCPQNTSIIVKVSSLELGRTQIEVKDNGPGIPTEHQAHIFDRFYRVDPARTKSSGGTGLGLSIVKWAVEAHGGNIQLSSTPGEGTCFQVIL